MCAQKKEWGRKGRKTRVEIPPGCTKRSSTANHPGRAPRHERDEPEREAEGGKFPPRLWFLHKKKKNQEGLKEKNNLAAAAAACSSATAVTAQCALRFSSAAEEKKPLPVVTELSSPHNGSTHSLRLSSPKPAAVPPTKPARC